MIQGVRYSIKLATVCDKMCIRDRHIIAERLRPHHLPQRDIVGVARAVQAAEEVQRAVVLSLIHI